MTGIPSLSTGAVDTSPSVVADASRLANGKNLAAAGQKFESIFTGMMLKAMRSTHLADDLFGSKAQDQFRDMWDQKTVEAIAAHTPLGIGKAMTAFLSKSQPTLAADTPKADVNQSGASPAP